VPLARLAAAQAVLANTPAAGQTAASKDAAETVKNAPPKGKRGRPRKNTEDTPKPPKGKRGRPRKNAEDTPKRPKGKRGRPRKTVEETPKPPKGKRGRPPGKKPPTSP
jgi:hypothetical protein